MAPAADRIVRGAMCVTRTQDAPGIRDISDISDISRITSAIGQRCTNDTSDTSADTSAIPAIPAIPANAGICRPGYAARNPSAPSRINGDNMKHPWITRLFGALLAVCLAGAASAADNYPSHPINIIVPFSVGGSTDSVGAPGSQGAGAGIEYVCRGGEPHGRRRRDRLAARLRRAGRLVYPADAGDVLRDRRQPDQESALRSQQGIHPHHHAGPGAACAGGASSVPAKTAQKFIALVKAHPDKYFFGSGGVGTNTIWAANCSTAWRG